MGDASLGGYFFDSPENIIFLIQRAETVIINLFSNVIEAIIAPLSDSTRLTLLLIVTFILWSKIQDLLRFAIAKLWSNEPTQPQDTSPQGLARQKEEQRKNLFRIYYGSNSWHSVLSKCLDYISLLLFYLIIAFLGRVVITSFEDKEFGVIDSIVAVTIILISVIAAVQQFLEISVIDKEILAVSKGVDLQELNLNVQDRLTDY